MIGTRCMMGRRMVEQPRIINGSFEDEYVVQRLQIMVPAGWDISCGRAGDSVAQARGVQSRPGYYTPPSDGLNLWGLYANGTSLSYGWVVLSQRINFTRTSALLFNAHWTAGTTLMRIGGVVVQTFEKSFSTRTVVTDTSHLNGYHLLELVAGIETTDANKLDSVFEFDYFRLLDTNGEALP